MTDTSCTKRKFWLLLFHLVLVCGFSFYAFRHQVGRLFIGNDGPMLISLADEQLHFFGISAGLHSNFLQGLGNISFPINVSAMPGFWFQIFGESRNIWALIYTFFAALMFGTVLLAGYNYRFPISVRYAAAWLLTLLFFPYFPRLGIYSITASAPAFVMYSFAAFVADIGLWQMGKRSWNDTALYAAVALLGVMIMLISSPVALILIMPFLCLSFCFSLYFADRDERIRKLAAAVILLLIAGACGWVEYVLGLLLNTCSGFFINDLLTTYPQDRQYVSILFHGSVNGIKAGPWLFGAGLLGALFVLYSKLKHRTQNTPLLPAAMLVIVGQVLLVATGEWLMHRSGGWTGPALVYYEMPLFILYALLAILLASHCIKCIPAKYSDYVHRYIPTLQYNLPVILVALLTALIWVRPAVKTHNPGDFAVPPASSEITTILEHEIGVQPKSTFNGRVVSSVPGVFYSPQSQYFSTLNAHTQNDYQSTGMWLKNIPTLMEYNPLITPGFYTIIRRFLSLPDDRQNRSWTNFSVLDTRILRLLGVRFVLSTTPVKGGLERASLPVATMDTLHLYELQNANTSGYWAKNMVSVASVEKAGNLMAAPAFDLQSALVMTPKGEELPTREGRLMPAKESRITIENGAYHIHATSDGWTMLILPIEYSHCLTIKSLSGDIPQAVRVDIALTGLLFKNALDVSLVQEISPFTHPRCRLKDYFDFKAMQP